MISPAQCRAARALLNWPQHKLAAAAHVGLITVRNFEAGKVRPRHATLDVIARAFQAEGVEFTDDGAPGVKLHARPARTRKR